jgi:hypothetical protein
MPSTSFLPSKHGLHFVNGWPAGTPALVVHSPLGDISVGDASQGVCGGMCFAARDLFDAGLQPPPGTTSPAGGSAMLNYLTRRLLASWDIPRGILTYYEWANTPDGDTLFGARHGVLRQTVEDQTPKVTASIDQGKPCTLGLVTIHSADPTQLKHCHQVLAYGYEWAASYLRLRVYDPNKPDDDTVYIGLETHHPEATTKVDHNAGIGRTIRGFFFVRYCFADPAVIAGPPWTDA